MTENPKPLSSQTLVGLVNLALGIRSHPFGSMTVSFGKEGTKGTLKYTHDGTICNVESNLTYGSVYQIRSEIDEEKVQEKTLAKEVEQSHDFIHPSNVNIIYAHFPKSEFDKLVEEAIPKRLGEGYEINFLTLESRIPTLDDVYIYFEGEGNGGAYNRAIQIGNPRAIPNFPQIRGYCSEHKIKLFGRNWSEFEE